MTGCANQPDSLKFIYENAGNPDTELALYEVNIGNKVSGGALVAELWQNGECLESSPITLNTDTKELHLSLLLDRHATSESMQGLNVQIGTEEVTDSELKYFEVPEDIKGYSFSAYEDKEVIEVAPNEEFILAAMAFDMGNGVRSIDCKTLVSDPSVLSSYSCIAVVRAKFV